MYIITGTQIHICLITHQFFTYKTHFINFICSTVYFFINIILPFNSRYIYISKFYSYVQHVAYTRNIASWTCSPNYNILRVYHLLYTRRVCYYYYFRIKIKLKIHIHGICGGFQNLRVKYNYTFIYTRMCCTYSCICAVYYINLMPEYIFIVI